MGKECCSHVGSENNVFRRLSQSRSLLIEWTWHELSLARALTIALLSKVHDHASRSLSSTYKQVYVVSCVNLIIVSGIDEINKNKEQCIIMLWSYNWKKVLQLLFTSDDYYYCLFSKERKKCIVVNSSCMKFPITLYSSFHFWVNLSS